MTSFFAIMKEKRTQKRAFHRFEGGRVGGGEVEYMKQELTSSIYNLFLGMQMKTLLQITSLESQIRYLLVYRST